MRACADRGPSLKFWAIAVDLWAVSRNDTSPCANRGLGLGRPNQPDKEASW